MNGNYPSRDVENYLLLPKTRKSVEIAREIQDKHINESLMSSPKPQATSTVERRTYDSLMDPYVVSSGEAFRHKDHIGQSVTRGSYESSLGILDMDVLKGIGDEASQVPSHRLTMSTVGTKSLSFNPGEMSGRSTFLRSQQNAKENITANAAEKTVGNNPSMKHRPSAINRSFCVKDIIREAEMQSRAVDEILKSSCVPGVANIRKSLNSYKDSIASVRTGQRANGSWNYCSPEFNTSKGVGDNNSELRDSMFVSANKMNMSKEELSWMKEYGDLPIHPQGNIEDTSINKTSEIFASSRMHGGASIRSDATNAAADISKMSVGNYFGVRSEDIKDIINARSPQKSGPHPPLFDPETDISPPSKTNNITVTKAAAGQTFRKSTGVKSSTAGLAFLTISDDSEMSEYPGGHTENQESRFDDLSKANRTNKNNTHQICKDITNTISIDDSVISNALSYTQIRNIMGTLESESPSSLLDRMLGLDKKKNEPPQIKLLPTNLVKDTIQTVNAPSPTLPDKSSFGQASNIFHSTKHGDEFLKRENTPKRYMSKSPAKEKKQSSLPSENSSSNRDSKSISSKRSAASASQFTLSSVQDENSAIAVSSLKNSGKSNSGSSEYTESTFKSVNTVVLAKRSSTLDAIKENTTETKDATYDLGNKENILSVSGYALSSGGSPRINSTLGKLSQGLLSPSDTSKELYGLVSPSSCQDVSKENTTPVRKTHSKNLLDRYGQFSANNSKVDGNGWLSPTQAKINDLSKECNPGQTPFKLEHTEYSPRTRASPKQEHNRMNRSDVTEHSLNVPIRGDWIKAESNKETVIVGSSHDLKINLISLSSRWISVEFTVNSVKVDGQPYSEDISDVVLLQAPVAKILLKADSQNGCILKILALVPNKEIIINLNIHLKDVVTKSESCVEHFIKLCAVSPKILVQNQLCEEIKSVQFPTIPEESDTCMPVIIWNESADDLPISLEIKCGIQNVFSIIGTELISKEELDEIRSSYLQLIHKNIIGELKHAGMKPNDFLSGTSEAFYDLPCNKSTFLKVLIYFRAPKLSSLNGDGSIQHIDATLNISLATGIVSDKHILIHSLPIIGGVGISSLLIRNRHKSDVLVIHHGTTEDVEMFNAGKIPMKYRIFMSPYYDEGDKAVTLMPCKNMPFTIDKSSIELQPGEKSFIKVSYPCITQLNSDVKRSLVFESPYTTLVCHVIGVLNPRSNSQQSTYSVDSAISQNQEMVVRCTKTELSWGSLKLGNTQVQDITFKNPSNDRKLRAIVTLIGEGFRVLSDNGPVTTLAFSLQPLECRSLRVEFRPVRFGGHSGVLRLMKRYSSTPNGDRKDKSKILYKAPLHGFGGQSTLVFRDGVFSHGGAQGLPLGSLNDSGATKDIFFTIWNRGTAPGFVLINIDLKWKYRSLANDVIVKPRCGVLAVGSALRCSVSVPRRALLLACSQPGQTETIASLTILHGDEASRLRIKRICSEYIKNDEEMELWNEKGQGKLNSLCTHFPEEDNSSVEIQTFNESTRVLKTLLDVLQQKEVMVTYDVDLDNTVARLSNDLDETLQFQTILADTTSLSVSSDSQ